MYLYCHEEYCNVSIEKLRSSNWSDRDVFKPNLYAKLLINVSMTKDEILSYYDKTLDGIVLILKENQFKILKKEGVSLLISNTENSNIVTLFAQQFEIWDEVTNDTDALLLYELR